MDAKIKADWLAALRSGEYKQGIGRLRQDGKFCCLGVLCDLYNKKLMKEELGNNCWKLIEDTSRFTFQGITDVLSLDTRKWADLPISTATILSRLMHLNACGYDFNYIADIIEKEL